MAQDTGYENKVLRNKLKNAKSRIAALERQLSRQSTFNHYTASTSGISLKEYELFNKQLKQSKNRYRKYFNYANDAMFVIALDRENNCFGKYVDVNKEATRRLGYTRQEFFAMTPLDINPPERAPSLQNLYLHICEQGSGTVEHIHIAKDGRRVPVEVSILLLEIDGEELILASARDITDRHQAEYALRERERLYRLLADNVHDVIWTTDITLKPVYISPSVTNLTGFQPAEALTVLYRSIILDSPLFENFRKTPWRTEMPPLHWELELHKKNNSTIWVESIASPLWDTSGAFSGIIGVTRDITSRKIIMQELENAKEMANRANQAKSEFLANMSHEIRTPMNGVLGTLQLLGLTELTPEQQEYVETAQTSGHSLLTIINDILDFSKIEARKITITDISFSPEELLESLLASFKSITQEKNLHFNAHISPTVPKRLIADHVRLRQILFNLVGNAIKFTDSGEINIRLAAYDTNKPSVRLHCTITDTGIGIPEQEGDHLFEPFSQVEGGYRKKYKGTGLGLSIVKQLVTLMGGTVQIANRQGRGTKVVFDIVCRKDDGWQSSAMPPIDPLPISSEHRPLRILLAEDELINQQILRSALTKLGHSINVVQNGRQALDSLRKQNFDFILLDIQMPEMDGIETTKIIRTEPDFTHVADIPIVALTAFAMTGDKEKCLSAGMNGYLSKPVNLNALAEALRQYGPSA